MDCVSTTSLKHCICTYTTCDKRGNCCKCIQYHRRQGEIPGCLFTPEGERSHDRSLAHFIEDRSR